MTVLSESRQAKLGYNLFQIGTAVRWNYGCTASLGVSTFFHIPKALSIESEAVLDRLSELRVWRHAGLQSWYR